MAQNLVDRLRLSGTEPQRTIEFQMVEVFVKPLGNNTCDAFQLFPYVHTVLLVGSDTVVIPALHEAYEHLSVFDPVSYSYASVELTLGQDVYHAI